MDQLRPTGVPDGELWRKAAKGDDPSAFGELFERHIDAVYNHCFRRTGSWEAAEDLASVVFLEAWRRRHDVSLSGESILPWLLAVANNVVRNRDRSLRRHRRLLAKLPPAVVAPDPADDAVSRVDDERAMQRVLEVFTRLLPDEQDVLALCVWAGLSYTDAAVALGIPVGTVRSRLSRAREHLRRLAGLEAGAGRTGGPAPTSSPGSGQGPAQGRASGRAPGRAQGRALSAHRSNHVNGELQP
ncbi:RNA polymerase sigma factor [Actinopolymorpha cephalotaxi]|uniref:RNA polymerase sigma-70 factor (ECF subfamily) n=1 Tax=Actinopolymorpha cephalotaxi TaxID=504797 RepID=A0ABX2SDP4_9ACTN|nr:RNA polymerase sigma factor [Actinopolymorpha cephalotaxi]NYH86397.1 RNA polymerase sigma-70 factor (ECF subfamily) [Actinopolymorpha cephalotaxi]